MREARFLGRLLTVNLHEDIHGLHLMSNCVFPAGRLAIIALLARLTVGPAPRAACTQDVTPRPSQSISLLYPNTEEPRLAENQAILCISENVGMKT